MSLSPSSAAGTGTRPSAQPGSSPRTPGLDPATRTRAAVLRGDWGAVREIGRDAVETLRTMLSEGYGGVIGILGELADDPRSLRALISHFHEGEPAHSSLMEALQAVAERQQALGLAAFNYANVDSSIAEARRSLTEDPGSFSRDEIVRLSQFDHVVTCRWSPPARGDPGHVVEILEISCEDIAKLASREQALRAGK